MNLTFCDIYKEVQERCFIGWYFISEFYTGMSCVQVVNELLEGILVMETNEENIINESITLFTLSFSR